MAASDRVLTLTEVLSGKVTNEYLDIKEQKAIIKRHITRLADQRFDIEDKMSVIGEKKELLDKHQKLTAKIIKLQNELETISI